MIKYYLIPLLILLSAFAALGQGAICVDSEPFCTSDQYIFPAGVNTGNAEPGPDYGCLGTQPNPAWYHLKIGVAGDIDILMYSTPTEDIDFICWGPFADPTAPCVAQLTGSAIVDCSYSISSTENCYIPNGQVGEYYILLITNFSNDPCNITFEKVGGTGETDCSIIPPPIGSNSPLCVGDNLDLWADDVPGASYLWTGPNGFTSTEQNPSIPNVGLQHAGDYTLVITVNGNQSSPVSTTVEIFARPTPDFSYLNSCVDESVTFTDLSTVNPPSEPITFWEWDFGDGQTSNLQNPTHLYPSTGTYTVTLTTYTGAMGCPQVRTIDIEVYNAPVADAGTDQTIPHGWYTQLDGNISGGSGQYSFSWSPAAMLVDPNVEDPQTVQLTADQDFVLQVTDLNTGCTNSDIVTVFVTGTPFMANASATPMSICAGGTVDLSVVASGGSGSYTYSWTSSPSGFTSNISNPSHSPLITTTYYVEVFDGQNTIISQVTVQVIPNPVVYAGPNQFIPAGTSTVLDGATVSGGSGNYTYSWTPAAFLIDPTVLNPQTVPLTQNVSFFLTVFDANGCQSNTDQVWVIPVYPPSCPTLTVDFTTTYTGCSEVLFEDNTTFDMPDPSYNIVDWHWDFGDGTFGTGNPITHQFERGIITDVKMVILVDSMGYICTDSINKLMTINQTPDVFVSSTPNPGCEGDAISFTGTSGFNIVLWEWDFGDGSVSSLNSPNQTHTYGSPGTYDVTLTVTDVNGCDSTYSPPYQQVIGENPVADFSWDPDPACLNAPVQFTDLSTSSSSIVSWSWNFGDGSTSSLQNPLHSFATPGIFSVTLTVTTSENCSGSITRMVDVNPLPLPDFATNTPVCFDDSVQFTNLSTSPNGSIVQWIWDLGDGNIVTVDAPNNPNISHLYSSTGTFQVNLTVTDSDSCQNTTSRLVEVVSNPISDFTFDDACFGDPVTFTDLSSPNGGPALFTWEWNFGDPLSGVNNTSGLQNPSHIFTSPGTFTVSLIVSNTVGCTDTSFQDVVVDSIPQIDFTIADDTICLGDDAIFTAIGNSFSSWFWDFGDGNTSTQQNPVHVYQLPGLYTVTLNATTTEGCFSTISYNIRVNQLPTADFEASTPACQNDSIAFMDQSSSPNGLIIQWIWDFSDGTVVTIDYPSSPNISHLFSSAGSYEVFLTVMDADSCQNTTSRIIQVITSPIANFTFTDACFGSPVLFTDLSSPNGGPDLLTWNWNFDDPPSGANNTSGLQNPSHIFTNPGTYNVSLMVTNTQGCFDTISMDVVVDSLPFVDFTMASDTICLGENAEFFGTGSNISQWQWDFGDGIGFSNQQNPVYVYTQAGTYTVTLTVTDVNGCQNNITYDIQVRNLPVVDFMFNNACSGDSTYFSDATVVTNGYAVAWDWDFGDGGVSTLQNPSHFYTNFGNYLVTLTVTDNFGCANSYSQLISVYDGPTAAFSFEAPCEPAGRVNFFDESTLSNDNSPILSWLWDFGDGLFSNEMNPQHTYLITDSCYTVSLTIADANGCSSSDTSFSVCVYQLLEIDFSYTDVCDGESVSFQANHSPSSDSIVAYTWYFNDGTNPITVTSDSITHIFPESGTYRVELIATNAIGCSAFVYKNVQINQLPFADFTYSQANCDSIQFYDESLGGGTQIISWYWDFGDPSSGASNFSDDQHPIHYYPPQDSTYQVKLIVTNLNGCVDSIVKTVERNPCLSADFYTPAGTLCANSEVCFNDNSTIASNNTNISNWYWDFGDGTTYTYDIQQNPVCHTYASGGTYEVTLIITAVTNNNITLRDSTIRNITISPSPDADFYVTSATCFGTLTQFTDISIENGGSITSWNWDFGDPANPASTSDQQNPAYMYSDHGVYLVELVVANDYGCSDTLEQEVEIYEKPEAAFSYDVSCVDKQTFFFDESEEGGSNISSWFWNFGNPLSIIDTSSMQDPYYTYHETGTYAVNLIITDDNMCQDTAIHDIEVYENPSADFEIYDNYEGEQGLIYFANLSEDANSYYWDFGDGQVSNEENPVITYSQDGLYTITLIAYSEEDCADTISYEYEMMYKTLYVPNAFVPGSIGDAYNPALAEDAAFIIKGVNLSEYTIEVYDVWGTLVWESNALINGVPAESWNGHQNGNPNLEMCPSGVYTWRINAIFRDGTMWKGSNNGDGNTNPYGTVTLIW